MSHESAFDSNQGAPAIDTIYICASRYELDKTGRTKRLCTRIRHRKPIFSDATLEPKCRQSQCSHAEAIQNCKSQCTALSSRSTAAPHAQRGLRVRRLASQNVAQCCPRRATVKKRWPPFRRRQRARALPDAWMSHVRIKHRRCPRIPTEQTIGIGVDGYLRFEISMVGMRVCSARAGYMILLLFVYLQYTAG